MVAVAGDVEGRLGHRLEHVEDVLDALVGLEAAQVEQPRLLRAPAAAKRPRLDAQVGDRDVVAGNAHPHEVVARRLRDGQTRGVAVQVAQRHRLERPEEQMAEPAEFVHVQVVVHVVDQGHPRLAQPERGEEGDAVDHLEHHVGVAPDPSPDGPEGPGEHRRAPAAAVYHQVGSQLLDGFCAGIGAGNDRDLVAPGDPAGDLPVQVGAVAAALRMGPVTVHQHEDVERPGVGFRAHETDEPSAVTPPPGRRLWDRAGGPRAASCSRRTPAARRTGRSPRW